MGMRKLCMSLISCALFFCGGAALAKTFTWSSAADIPTWDIHSQNNALVNGIHAAVYESLVFYDSRSFKLKPLLATKWQQLTPVQLRVTLRTGVKFHNGAAFSADDAVFSILRAMSKTSTYTPYTSGIDRVVKVDANTIDIFTKDPNPVLLNQLTELRIMSKAWAEENGSALPKDITTREETFAHRNANGTGPFMLKEWLPEKKLVLAKNPLWWAKTEGDITEIVYLPMKDTSARMAALYSGEVDFVLDPNPQDLPRIRAEPALRVVDGVENRTILLGMDQFRDDLPGSNVKGKNPLKDPRVRKALYQAIDMDAITRETLDGLGQSTGALVAPQVNGWSEAMHKRYPYDVAAARKLLEDAGYMNGFTVYFLCPNDRYIKDEQICQSIVSMWAGIGVEARLRTEPSSIYFPLIQRYQASIYLLGWGVPTYDAFYTLQSLLHSVGSGGDGNYNLGRYNSPQMDELIEKARRETDSARRTALLTKALLLQNEDVAHIPLHNQVIPWAMKKSVEVIHRPDNRIEWPYLKVK